MSRGPRGEGVGLGSLLQLDERKWFGNDRGKLGRSHIPCLTLDSQGGKLMTSFFYFYVL